MIKFTKGDVTAEPAGVPGCGECTDGDYSSEPKGTHAILLDFRSAGEQTQLGPFLYCESCANEIVGRIRESLPDDDEE